jgi:hypothetical protein
MSNKPRFDPDLSGCDVTEGYGLYPAAKNLFPVKTTGHLESDRGQKVRWLLEELAIPYEVVPIKGELT